MQEFAIEGSKLSNPRERLALQRQLLKQRLGLVSDPCDFNMDHPFSLPSSSYPIELSVYARDVEQNLVEAVVDDRDLLLDVNDDHAQQQQASLASSSSSSSPAVSYVLLL